jgi:transcriptional regulator
MFKQPIFREEREALIHDLIMSNSFGTLISVIDGELTADHLPFLFKAKYGDNCVLHAHIAKGNPLWINNVTGGAVLVIFQGAHHYISPSWYASKAEHEKVVPTWNYAVVHAHGTIKFIEDQEWLKTHINEQTNKNEQNYDTPWKVSDAPEKYIDGQLKGIVGIEIEITRFDAKWKMSQNKNAADKEGVIKGLLGEKDANARDMAIMMSDSVK